MSILSATRRSESSKPKQLRRNGVIPMALVQRTHETLSIQAPLDAFRRAMSQADGHGRFELLIDGESTPRKAIVKQIEKHALRQEWIHVTLLEVAEDDLLKIDVPIVATGENEELKGKSVVLNSATDHIRVRGKVTDLPERFEVDISNLQPGEHITAADLPLPAGVELLSTPDLLLFSLQIVKEEADVTAETDSAEAPSEEAAQSKE